MLNSQQPAECMSICDEFLQSQNSCGSEDEHQKSRRRLAEYGHLPADDLKKDLEECQKLDDVHNTNLELECTPEFRLSQLVNLAVVHHRVFSVYQLSYLVLIFCSKIFHKIALIQRGLKGKSRND